jgi:hypothetical protein
MLRRSTRTPATIALTSAFAFAIGAAGTSFSPVTVHPATGIRRSGD